MLIFHFFKPYGTLCGKPGARLLSQSFENIDCPECLEIIRKCSVKVHKRRRIIQDMSIIYKVLDDKQSFNSLSPEDQESYEQRYNELVNEAKLFGPESPEEFYLMGELEYEVNHE